MIKGDSGPAPGHWAIKGGDAQIGALKSYWDGHRAPKYAPMKKQVRTRARMCRALAPIHLGSECVGARDLRDAT